MYQYHFLYGSAQNYKIKSKANAIFVIQSTNRIICTYFWENCLGWHHSRSDCKRRSTMTYHFYFKNSEPVYETEYMQCLKQFALQEVFSAYVLNSVIQLFIVGVSLHPFYLSKTNTKIKNIRKDPEISANYVGT